MKKALVFGILSMMLPMVSQAQEAVESEMQKIYVEPSQIAFAHQGIFAFVEGQWIPVESVSIDANGLYAKPKNIHHGRWICPRSGCRYNNDPWQDFCQNQLPSGALCMHPRPDR